MYRSSVTAIFRLCPLGVDYLVVYRPPALTNCSVFTSYSCFRNRLCLCNTTQKVVDVLNPLSVSVSPFFDPRRRNWFRIFRLVTMIAIGLRNPYAKSETGAGLVLVWCLLTARCLMFYGYICSLTGATGSKYLEYNSSWQKTILNKWSNRTLNKQITEYWIIEQSKSNKNRTDRIIGWTEERNAIERTES